MYKWNSIFLQVNTTIETVDVSYNKIGDAGAIAFAEALKVHVAHKSNKTMFLTHLESFSECNCPSISDIVVS